MFPGTILKNEIFLRTTTNNHGKHCPFKYKEACYGGNNPANKVKFDEMTEEVNTMKYHDDRIPKKKKGNKQK